MEKVELIKVVRDDKEKDFYRAFIPDIDMVKTKITKNYLEKNYKLCGLKVKKIVKTELATERFGTYIYFKGEK